MDKLRKVDEEMIVGDKSRALEKLRSLYVHGKGPAEQVKLLECDDNHVKSLISYGILVHYHQVDTHRQAIEAVYCLLKPVCPHLICLEQQINDHDLSKYGEREAFGYTHKWVHNLDSQLWQDSCRAHVTGNKHHPQYFGSNSNMDENDLTESVIDMLGCRFERDLPGEEVSLKELFDIADKYLGRYTTRDKYKVEKLLTEWTKTLNESLAKDKNIFNSWQDRYGRILKQ